MLVCDTIALVIVAAVHAVAAVACVVDVDMASAVVIIGQ